MSLDAVCPRFAALSDPTRLRMMLLLHRHGELCVCEIVQALAIPQPKASKHLAVLREAGLVDMRRDAQWVLYAPASEAGAWLNPVLAATVPDLTDDARLNEDTERLAAMSGRPERRSGSQAA